jgi:glycosyltransferase involved in cell wall biosynthesis
VWVGSTNNGSSRLARLDKHVRGIANDLRMFRLLRESRYDFVQVKDKFLVALPALLACKLRGVPMVFWLSYPFPESDLYAAREGTARYPLLYWIRGSIFKWLLYRVILRFAAHGFVQSEQMKRDVVGMGIQPEKLTAVPMGVATSLLSIQLPSPAAGWPERNVAYLGTLARNRRLDMIVRAFRRVVDAVPDAKLYFIGGGDDAKDVEILASEVQRLELEAHVVFTGFLPRDKALEVVARALVCLSPFYPTPIFNSTSPTKLIEYMALGRAVVGNHHPEQRLLIEESQGGLSVEWDEEAFADAMIALLEDPARAIDMGRRGQRYVREHRTYERIAAAVESRYLALCAPDSRGRASAPAE